jgi:hypothetical protein
MKPFVPKVSWTTKYISNRNYIQEVSIDGNKTSVFKKKMGYHELFVPEVMRNGNCLTLLTSNFDFSLAAFKNLNLLETIVKYVFWTFNEGFLLQLSDFIKTYSIDSLEHIEKLLTENRAAYQEPITNQADEELQWCMLKNSRLRGDKNFETMYEKDASNRNKVLAIVQQIIANKKNKVPPAENNKKPMGGKVKAPLIPNRVLFSETLQPIEGSTNNTINIIKDLLQTAKAKYDIFLPFKKTKANKNPKGFNGTMAATISFFYEQKYFKPKFSKEEIMEAFLNEYAIIIPKYKGSFLMFTNDYDFETLIKRLKRLEIKPLI